MDKSECANFVRAVLDKFYQGHVSVLEDVSWGYSTNEGAVGTFSIFEDEHTVRINAGVAVEVPLSTGTLRKVCEINSNLYFGRALVEAQGDEQVAILLQEIVPLGLISYTFQPSIDYVLTLMRSLPHAAATELPDILASCGGTAWTNVVALAMSG